MSAYASSDEEMPTNAIVLPHPLRPVFRTVIGNDQDTDNLFNDLKSTEMDVSAVMAIGWSSFTFDLSKDIDIVQGTSSIRGFYEELSGSSLTDKQVPIFNYLIKTFKDNEQTFKGTQTFRSETRRVLMDAKNVVDFVKNMTKTTPALTKVTFHGHMFTKVTYFSGEDAYSVYFYTTPSAENREYIEPTIMDTVDWLKDKAKSMSSENVGSFIEKVLDSSKARDLRKETPKWKAYSVFINEAEAKRKALNSKAANAKQSMPSAAQALPKLPVESATDKLMKSQKAKEKDQGSKKQKEPQHVAEKKKAGSAAAAPPPRTKDAETPHAQPSRKRNMETHVEENGPKKMSMSISDTGELVKISLSNDSVRLLLSVQSAEDVKVPTLTKKTMKSILDKFSDEHASQFISRAVKKLTQEPEEMDLDFSV
jgi:hypothetical protein